MGDKVLNTNYTTDVTCYVCATFFLNILFINYSLRFEKHRNFCLNVNRGTFFPLMNFIYGVSWINIKAQWHVLWHPFSWKFEQYKKIRVSNIKVRHVQTFFLIIFTAFIFECKNINISKFIPMWDSI